jgi:PAS domain S-box-containing protein
MKVREIMTSNPITLKPNQTVGEATVLFFENKIDAAPVLDEQGKLIGLFVKSHIYRVITSHMNMATEVKDLMTNKVISAHPDDELDELLRAPISSLPVIDETGVVGMVTRKELAQAFINSYRELSIDYREIIDSIYNLVIAVDKLGIIKVFNSSAERVLGVKAKDAIGKSILEIIPNSRLIEVIKSGKEEVLQKIEIKDSYAISNRTPIIKNGNSIGAVGVFQDISEYEKVSQELCYVKKLNEDLDAIFQSSFDGLFMTDASGIILRYNKAFEGLTGINAEEYLGRNVEFIKKDGIMSDLVSLQVLEKKKPVTIIQESRYGKENLTTGNPVFDKMGRVSRIVINVRDITELNLLRQKLEQVNGLSKHYESQLRTLRLRYSGTEKLVVTSNRMSNLVDMVIRLAAFDSTILITGESGTGKELIAETIHSSSARSDKAFIKVNCGAIPENLMESELFGYEAGAFTGAKKEGKPGYVELASGGTLFLDEIGEVPLNLQVKLLRLLQNKEIMRIGGRSHFKVDVRIIAATNRNLLEMVHNKEFREDLYYRLNVVPVNVPPLRDRKEDIPALVAHFIQQFNRKYNMTKNITSGLLDVLMEYDWPGNIRELENLIERLIVITPKDLIRAQDLPAHLGDSLRNNSDEPCVMVNGIIPLRDAVESVERQLLEKVYSKNITTREMAKELEVNASTIVRKAAKYNITAANR